MCWQELMDEAYNRWQKGGDLHGVSRIEFLDELQPVQRKAVLIGNLNYQVQNGGFDQWIGNGYALQALRVSALLKQIGTPTCLKVREMVEEILPFLNLDSREQGCLGSYLKSDLNRRRWDDEEECEDETEGHSFDHLDDKFYDLNEEFMKEVETFFATHKFERSLT
jgi:hypothetical protein